MNPNMSSFEDFGNTGPLGSLLGGLREHLQRTLGQGGAPDIDQMDPSEIMDRLQEPDRIIGESQRDRARYLEAYLRGYHNIIQRLDAALKEERDKSKRLETQLNEAHTRARLADRDAQQAEQRAQNAEKILQQRDGEQYRTYVQLQKLSTRISGFFGLSKKKRTKVEALDTLSVLKEIIDQDDNQAREERIKEHS